MKKNTQNKKATNSVLFLNLPIDSSSKDVIGFSAYAESLSEAIDNNAQTIAVTSSFGMGKTSIVELLKEIRIERKDEQILKVPMWSQLSDDDESEATLNLHRNFVYQIASQMNRRRGTYVSRRLSPNYRLLKVHTNKPLYWVLIVLAIIGVLFAWAANSFGDWVIQVLPALEGRLINISIASIMLSVIFGIIAIVGSEIIISRARGENERRIEMDEIIEIYYSEILRYRVRLLPIWAAKLLHRFKHYIIVIEDLDRSNNNEAIKDFLKEMRKYYIPTSSDSSYKFLNKITFIINIKSESEIEADCLYEKVFDYILNIQPINIDDYSIILEGLLQEKKDEISTLGLCVQKDLSSLPGMQWIIREPKVGMRAIKERLNRTFALYRSLRERFPSGSIAFEKCAVVAYITTAFEAEFNETDDSAFQKIVEWNLKLRAGSAGDENAYITFLPENKNDYASTIIGLVRSGIIDTNYRMYFYNYPKNSRIYSMEESITQKAILYGENSIDLNQSVLTVEERKSTIVGDSINRLKQLGLPLPEVVFQTKELYKAVLKRDVNGIIQWINNRDYKPEATEKTISQIEAILSFDSSKEVYSRSVAMAFSKAWEEKMSEQQLLRLRLMLCRQFPKDILWYQQLYRGVHSLARFEELDLVAFDNAIELIDQSNKEFSTETIEYLIDRYEKTNDRGFHHERMVSFIISATERIDSKAFAQLCVRFMLIDGIIVDSLEEIIFDEIDNLESSQMKNDPLYVDYKKLIVKAAPSGLSKKTMDNIQYMDDYQCYSDIVARELEKGGYLFESIMILLSIDTTFDPSRKEIVEAISDNKEWLLDNIEFFSLMRKRIISAPKKTIQEYKFLFAEDCPIVSEAEFKEIIKTIPYDDLFIISLIPAQLVTKNEIQMLSRFFNREWHYNSVAFEILQYVASFRADVAQECFRSLDFGYIKYQDFSTEKRSIIKKLYESILNLDTTQGKIQFMTLTKRLDSSWENEILQEINSNEQLQAQYINAVNEACARSITNTTIKTLCSLNKIYPMPSRITNRLFMQKRYKHYIVSKTLFDKVFTIETEEKGDVLWVEYLKILKESIHHITIEYMCNNKEFLRMIMEKKEYIGMKEDVRLKLSSIYQDSDSLLDVINYGDDFALKYYLQMAGFKDEEAATAFVNIIERSHFLLSSQELYDHAHGKLISGTLKGRYTRLRNRIAL